MSNSPGGSPSTPNGSSWWSRMSRSEQIVAAVAGALILGILGIIAAVVGRSSGMSGNTPPSSGIHASTGSSSQGSNPVALQGTTVLAIPASQGVRSVAYSPDGKFLAAGDANGHVYVWPVGSKSPVSDMTDPDSKGVNSVAFNPSSSVLASGDANGSIYLWGGNPHHLIGTLTDPASQGVRSILVSTDGTVIVAGDANGHVYVWPINGGKLKENLPDPRSGGVNSVAFEASNTASNTTIAAGDNNGRIYLWLYKLISTQTNPGSEGVLSVAYSPQGKFLAAADKNGHIYIRSVGS